MNVRKVSIVFQVVLWSLTFALSMVWLFVDRPPFEPEPLTVVAGLIASASSAILKRYEDELRLEEFCTADALAMGYVNNFLEPVLTQLIKEGKSPFVIIFIPKTLVELQPKNIDRMLGELRKSALNDEVLSVKLDEGRGWRDIMSIRGNVKEEFFIDFPSTLLTLQPLIDFKVSSQKDSFNKLDKQLLASRFISKFEQTAQSQLQEQQLFPQNSIFLHDIEAVKSTLNT